MRPFCLSFHSRQIKLIRGLLALKKPDFATQKIELGLAYVVRKKEIAERVWEMLHSEIMRSGEPSLLVLLLQEEQDAGKETHHLFTLAREATRISPQGFIQAP